MSEEWPRQLEAGVFGPIVYGDVRELYRRRPISTIYEHAAVGSWFVSDGNGNIASHYVTSNSSTREHPRTWFSIAQLDPRY